MPAQFHDSVTFRARVSSTVTPTNDDDLVRLRDLDGGVGVAQAVRDELVALGFIVVWDGGATTWDDDTVQWRE
jgi:hypothetical protein